MYWWFARKKCLGLSCFSKSYMLTEAASEVPLHRNRCTILFSVKRRRQGSC